MIKYIFSISIVAILCSCGNDDEQRQIFVRYFPSDKQLDASCLTYEKQSGFYFVTHKEDSIFKLVCSDSFYRIKGCIRTWGITSKEEFLRLTPLIEDFYRSGFELDMVSKTSDGKFVLRLTRSNVFWKDVMYVDRGGRFELVSEREW